MEQHLLVPPIEECPRLLPCIWRGVSFEVVNNKVIELLVVEVVIYAAPVGSRLECKMKLRSVTTWACHQMNLVGLT